MQLPGKLSLSTLGDLLGSLHRGRASGVLVLREARGLFAGRRHQVHLRSGLVTSVETAGQTDDATDPASVQRRLDQLFSLPEAELSFEVARRQPPSPRPLSPADFLHGRPRQRDRASPPTPAPGPVASAAGRPPSTPPPPPARPVHDRGASQALATLGLPTTASGTEVRQAFRRLALALHPDRHPDASEARRAELSRQLASVVQAYRVLVGVGAA